MFEMSGLVATAFGAFLAAGLSMAGSAYGTHLVGSANSTALAEGHEDKFTNLIILQVLPGTQGIYGFIVLFMLLSTSGVSGSGGEIVMTAEAGQVALWAGLLMGVTGLSSAMLQGKVAAMSVPVAIKQPEATMKAVIFCGIVELYAVLGLIASILLINSGIKPGVDPEEMIGSIRLLGSFFGF
jgi:V/A-type H+/Na+-transporting ATPase subunit K